MLTLLIYVLDNFPKHSPLIFSTFFEDYKNNLKELIGDFNLTYLLFFVKTDY